MDGSISQHNGLVIWLFETDNSMEAARPELLVQFATKLAIWTETLISKKFVSVISYLQQSRVQWYGIWSTYSRCIQIEGKKLFGYFWKFKFNLAIKYNKERISRTVRYFKYLLNICSYFDYSTLFEKFLFSY